MLDIDRGTVKFLNKKLLVNIGKKKVIDFAEGEKIPH